MATTRQRLTGRYADRAEAGRALGDAVAAAGPLPRPVVLALPRGGVPVAAGVAARLSAPLEVIVVRKIGAPGRAELAMGALAMVGSQVSLFRNEEVIAALRVGEATFAAVHERELAELQRRGEAFTRAEPIPVTGADVVLVDDGLATGSTMLAAVAAVRRLEPARVVVAVPVASRPAVRAVRAVADEVICPMTPAHFVAVGLAYGDFHQLTDHEVEALLRPGNSG
jgi:putative phosphoribosyl transferase